MLTYYPPIKPYAEHRLAVDSPHNLYIEECGNPKGIPILVVHGGPGSGCSEDSRRYFDPNIYRIILFDQRGAGRSTPHAELRENNTQALVRDMEAIRQLLNIDRWILFGGSWGATLSLVYAQTHPERVISLILRGIFLGRNQDLEWLYDGKGPNHIFPDYWEELVNFIPEGQRHNLLQAYYDILIGRDEVAQMAAAKNWSRWEVRTARLEPNPQLEEKLTDPFTAIAFARIECHYFMNNCFLEPNQILSNMPKIQHIPAIIVHGRYDMICPLSGAWELCQIWPQAELEIIRNAGHAGSEPGILDGMIRATQKMASRLR